MPLKFIHHAFIALLMVSLYPTSGKGQWFRLIFPSNDYLSMINVNGNDVFIGTIGKVPFGSHLYRSIDGLPWTRADSGMMIRGDYWGMGFTDKIIFAATEAGVFRSSDYGKFWVWTNTGSTYNTFASAISVEQPSTDTPFVFVGANGEGVYRSTDYGNTWQTVNVGLTQKWVQSFASKDSFLFAGVPNLGNNPKGCIYRTSNYGSNWKVITNGLKDSSTQALVAAPFGLLAGTWSGGVFLSTDNGDLWQAVNNNHVGDTVVHSLAVSGSTVLAGTRQGVFISSDSCRTWQQVNEGLPPDQWIYHLACTSTMVYAATYPDSGVWMRPLSDLVPVEPISQPFPDQYRLDQNYPNPFNPSTTITYTIPIQSFITIRVFDILGRKVETLVSGVIWPGQYQVRWNTNGVPSGVYLCRLEADRSIQVRRMLLVR